MFCSVRNALITYLLNSQSIWILILALNLYRLLCEEKPRQRIALYFFAGLIFPCLMSTLSFLFGAGCSLSIWRTNIWFIAGSAVFILLLGFYVMATSLLISMGGGKHEGPRIIKKAMRRSVLWLEILVSRLFISNVAFQCFRLSSVLCMQRLRFTTWVNLVLILCSPKLFPTFF